MSQDEGDVQEDVGAALPSELGAWCRLAWRTAKSSVMHPRSVVQVERPLSKWAAWAVVLGAFAIMFGRSTVFAVQYMVDPYPLGSDTSWSELLVDKVSSSVAPAAVVGFLTWFIIRRTAGRWGRLGWHGWRGELRAGTAVLAGTALSFTVMDRVGGPLGLVNPTPEHATPTTQDTVGDFFDAAMAGLEETALFTVLIPVALLAAGYGWKIALPVSAVLHVAFHLYYGPAAVALVIWAVFAVLVVQRTGCMWGVCLMHGVWDLGATLVNSDSEVVEALGLIGMMCLLAASVGAVVMALQQAMHITQAEETATASP